MYTHENGILLRKVERRDIYHLLNLKKESWFGTHRVSILSEDNQEDWYDSLPKDAHQPPSLILMSEFRNNVPEIVGPMGTFKLTHIDWPNRKADVGWDIFEELRGQGFGKKIVEAGVEFCFNILNLHRLDAEILENNIASQKCAKYAGFVKEGVKKEAILRNKEYIDSFVYGCIST